VEELTVGLERRMLDGKGGRIRLDLLDRLDAGDEHPDIRDRYGDRAEEEERVYHALYRYILEPPALRNSHIARFPLIQIRSSLYQRLSEAVSRSPPRRFAAGEVSPFLKIGDFRKWRTISTNLGSTFSIPIRTISLARSCESAIA